MRILDHERDSEYSHEWRFAGQDTITLLLPNPNRPQHSLLVTLFGLTLLWIYRERRFGWFSITLLGLSLHKRGRKDIEIDWVWRPHLGFSVDLELFNLTVVAIAWQYRSIRLGLLGFDIFIEPEVVIDAILFALNERRDGIRW
jgi:hypothetical protein